MPSLPKNRDTDDWRITDCAARLPAGKIASRPSSQEYYDRDPWDAALTASVTSKTDVTRTTNSKALPVRLGTIISKIAIISKGSLYPKEPLYPIFFGYKKI